MKQAEALKAVISTISCPLTEDQVGDGAYTLSEGYAWADDVTVSPEQVILCWKLVEFVAAHDGKLPAEFRL